MPCRVLERVRIELIDADGFSRVMYCCCNWNVSLILSACVFMLSCVTTPTYETLTVRDQSSYSVLGRM